jgi:glycosyltransferase involved in cell wall biosynthesis
MTRLAILSYSNGRFDARSRRIARSAAAAGYEPVLYARWEPGLPLTEVDDGVRIVRVPTVTAMAFAPFRPIARQRVARLRAAAAASGAGPWTGPTAPELGPVPEPGATASTGPRPWRERLADLGHDPVGVVRRVAGRVVRRPIWAIRRTLGPYLIFPLRPISWAAALIDVAEPADVWHGMWAGSLPALVAMKARHGGRAVYDSRDIYTHARIFDRMSPRRRRWFLDRERGWARRVDLVVTVNDAYADLLAPLLDVPRPLVVRNCLDAWEPPGDRPPDLVREALGLPPAVAIVLYQGGLLTDRGIEEGMEAILAVPDAHLVVLGFGAYRDRYATMARDPRYRSRVTLLPPVPPDDLLAWTASADVMLMAIQPTSLNHRYTTPQKLWEAIAAGVPVVASDLPGMAEVVGELGCGVVCDPTDPAAIAAATREVLGWPAAEREATRERLLAAARGPYGWAAQAEALLAAYGRLAAVS